MLLLDLKTFKTRREANHIQRNHLNETNVVQSEGCEPINRSQDKTEGSQTRIVHKMRSNSIDPYTGESQEGYRDKK